MQALHNWFVVVLLTGLAGCGHMGAITGAGVGAHAGGTGGAIVGAAVGSVIDATNQPRRVVYRQGHPAQLVYQHGHVGAPVYGAPCQPYPADGLMAWAQGAGGNTQHSRTANVTTYNGVTNCMSSESAGSSSSGTAIRR